MLYDQKCDQFIMSRKFNAVYDSDVAKELVKLSKRSDKRRKTLSKTSIMMHNDKFIALYNKIGNKTNEWRIEVFHAVRVEGQKVAEIEIIIVK